MKCDWQGYLRVVPQRIRMQVDVIGKDHLQELRLRVGRHPELVLKDSRIYLDAVVTEDDITFCINSASQYSPWAANTVTSGYLTAQGGHRIGICGQMTLINGKMISASSVTSLCIRVARDFPGLARSIPYQSGSILIIGRPGCGKTTLLRDLIRMKSNFEAAAVGVVDERRELFPVNGGVFCFSPGQHTDVITGCNKTDGITILVRSMNPRYIAVDEITAAEDCRAMLQARGCGVEMIATAHAADIQDLMDRPVYKPILVADMFQNLIVMQSDNSWKLERMNV